MNLAEFGGRIKIQREKNRLTQAQLANSLQITAQAVSKWERGENAPDISLLKSLSLILGISIDWLLTGEDTAADTFNATIFCSSLRGYADKSTKLHPRDIALWINGIFHVLTESVLSLDGVPIKYVGDGFLAYFTQNNHSHRAIEAALKAWKAVGNKDLLITLNRGNIYLGAIGHHEYSHPDIMGNTVNIAFFMNQWCTVVPSENSLYYGNGYISQSVKQKISPIKTGVEWVNIPSKISKLPTEIYRIF